MLVTDSVVAQGTDESQKLLSLIANHTKHHGCMAILMGFFASTIDPVTLDTIFRDYFDLRWKPVADTEIHKARLVASDQSLLRTSSLVPRMLANAAWSRGVLSSQAVYVRPVGNMAAYPTYAQVGLCKLSYIGDTGFIQGLARLILSMCRLDRPEDNLREPRHFQPL